MPPAKSKSSRNKRTSKNIGWKLLDAPDALSRILGAIRPTTRVEHVPIANAAGRVLARDIVAKVTLPAHATSERDGYALRASDAARSGAKLVCIGEVTAGRTLLTTVAKGQCVRIATGALLPKGCDSVAMFEDCAKTQPGTIEIATPVKKGAWVAQAGSDVRKGDMLLRKGDILTPAQISYLGACGFSLLPVRAKPRAVVFTTGNEVRKPGEALRPGQVYDGNSAALAALLEANGLETTIASTVRDNQAAMQKRLTTAARTYDMVVFTGGTSVGDKDYGRRALDAVGTTLVHGVNVKPGKPLLFGTIGRVSVFGLPGFPTSALMVAYHFLVPAAHRMSSYASGAEAWVEGELATDLRPERDKLFLVPVGIDGQGRIIPVFGGSASVSSVGRAIALVALEPGQVPLKAGSIVAARLL